jgi:hypothetical protein
MNWVSKINLKVYSIYPYMRDYRYIMDFLCYLQERMEDRRMTLEAEGRSGCSGVAVTDVMGPGTKGRERLQGRVEPKGKDRVLTSELRAYEERMLESDRRMQERAREQEERIRVQDERILEIQRDSDQKAREMEAMKDQIAQLMQSLQNRPPS